MDEITPEQKAKINEMLRRMGETKTYDELVAIRKRSARVVQEWACQDKDAREALPQDIKDAKMITNYALLLTLNGAFPPVALMSSIEMAIEAAYNLGKAAPKS